MTLSWVLTSPEHTFSKNYLTRYDYDLVNFSLQHQKENVSGGPYPLRGNQAFM